MKPLLSIAAILVYLTAGANAFSQPIIFSNPPEQGRSVIQVWPAALNGRSAQLDLKPGQHAHMELVSPGKFNLRTLQWTPDGNSCTRWYVENLDLRALANQEVLAVKVYARREAIFEMINGHWTQTSVPPGQEWCVWEFGAAQPRLEPTPVDEPLPVQPDNKAIETSERYLVMSIPAGCPIVSHDGPREPRIPKRKK